MATSQQQHQLRSVARRKSLQILFQCEICGCDPESVLAEGRYLEEVGIPCEFMRLLLQGVSAHTPQIDELIVRTSENWSLERMPLVDRSILRLAIFEMLYMDDIPYSVSINEAVELAKSFGGEDESSRFVNGVLGRIASHLAEQAAADGGGAGSGNGKARSKRERRTVHG